MTYANARLPLLVLALLFGCDLEAGDDAALPCDCEVVAEASSGTDPSAEAESGGAPIPEGLLGGWSVVDSTAAISLELRDDGTYVKGNRAELTIGTCTRIYEYVQSGELTIDGDSLVLQPTSGLQRIDDCGTLTEEDEVPEPSEYTWVLATDQWGRALRLTDGDGTITYHR